MTLKVVQDTSTNWTAEQWRKIERLKKVLADSDNRSGRMWVVGALVNELAPLSTDSNRSGGYGGGVAATRDPQVLRDLALEVGVTPEYLSDIGRTETTWAPTDRVPGVGFSVFKVLTSDPDRKRILAQLLKVKNPFDITINDARRAVGATPNVPKTVKEFIEAFETRLDRFETFGARDILAIQKLILRLQVLIGERSERVS
jgi:hypothetical protein